MSTASKVAAHKLAHPEKYCLQHRCLWRTDSLFCPRHTALRKPTAPYKVQAQQIAKLYNELAKREHRPDLEETK